MIRWDDGRPRSGSSVSRVLPEGLYRDGGAIEQVVACPEHQRWVARPEQRRDGAVAQAPHVPMLSGGAPSPHAGTPVSKVNGLRAGLRVGMACRGVPAVALSMAVLVDAVQRRRARVGLRRRRQVGAADPTVRVAVAGRQGRHRSMGEAREPHAHGGLQGPRWSCVRRALARPTTSGQGDRVCHPRQPRPELGFRRAHDGDCRDDRRPTRQQPRQERGDAGLRRRTDRARP